MIYTKNSTLATTLLEASGTIPYNMTNDYMFRAVLQSNNKVLRGLICSLLHLTEADIYSVEIMNPVILGESLWQKEFRLDINILLNDNTLINLEMQVINKHNWSNRSISYICRSFDQLYRGQGYQEARPVIHISFLDYTLFPDVPEFYAIHKIMNIKNHHIYSDNFTLNVVDLSQIALATEEDKAYHIDEWASLFKSTTWEELKMLASKNDYLSEASETIFRLSTDAQIQKQCQDREEYYQDLRYYENTIAQQRAAISNMSYEIAKKKSDLAEKDSEIQALRAELERLKGNA